MDKEAAEIESLAGSRMHVFFFFLFFLRDIMQSLRCPNFSGVVIRYIILFEQL